MAKSSKMLSLNLGKEKVLIILEFQIKYYWLEGYTVRMQKQSMLNEKL